jgi:hypothetical protein
MTTSGADGQLGERPGVVVRTELLDQLRLEALAPAGGDVRLEAALPREHRGQQPDRTGARDERDPRLEPRAR